MFKPAPPAHQGETAQRQPQKSAGTAWNADLRSARAGLRPAHGASVIRAVVPLSAPTPPARAARQPGSAGVHTGTAPRSGARAHNANRKKARGRLGTPTSGQFSRWGPARAGLRPAHGASVTRAVVPPSAPTPPARAARRPGSAGVHTGTAPCSGARARTSQFRDGAHLGTSPAGVKRHELCPR